MQLQNPILQPMKRLLRPAVFLLSVVMWQCGGKDNYMEEEMDDEPTALLEEILRIEDQLLATMPMADTALAADLIQKINRYTTALPYDTLSAQLMIKAANLFLLFPDMEVNALRQLQLVYTRFAGQNHAAQALFLSGMIYDNNLRQPQQAIKMWEQLIEQYPGHPLSAQAATLLKITDEDPSNDIELIQKWLNDPKNKTNQIQVQTE